MTLKHLSLAAALSGFSALVLKAEVTYIDATTTNVTRVDGNAFAPAATSNVYTDGNWSLRTGYASNGSIFEGGGGEAAPALVQTLTAIPAGSYDVYVFFWAAGGVHWQIDAGLTIDSTTNFYGTGGAATSPPATTGLASLSTYIEGFSPTVFAEADRTMIRATIGRATVDGSGVLEVFIKTSAIYGGNATNSRIWFDGVGYGPPAPPEILPGAAVEIAPDGTWTWFNDERSIVHQGSLFSGYVKSAGQTGITRYNLATGEKSHMVISTAASLQKDDHNNPSITPLADGKLLAIYSKHGSASVFYQRTSLVALPSADSDWGPEIAVPMPAANTYANTYRLSGEQNTIYDFSRCINYNPTLTLSTDNGATWGTSRQLVGTGTGSTRPYPRYTSNGVDRIDLIYTDGHPRDVPNSVYHMFYRNGGLHQTDGTLIDSLANIPLDHDAGQRGGVVYQFSSAAWGPGDGPDDWIPTGRGWTWDVHYGPGGNPVCVFQVQVDNAASTGSITDRIYYYYARWTGTSWQRRFIAQAGRPLYAAEDDYAGGMCLDPEDPRVVYLSSNAASPFDLSSTTEVPLRTGERYEIWRGFTADGGLTFRWTQLTVDSPKDNLRPIVPMHHGHSECVVWFYGTYNTYTNFSTRVLARIGTPQISFKAWSANHSLPANGTLDSDHDGSDNLVEFALGGDPLEAASRPLPIWQDGAYSFPWPDDRSGIEWVVQESEDLATWATAAILRNGVLPNEIGSAFSFTTSPGRHAVLTPRSTTRPNRFLRLKVVTVP